MKALFLTRIRLIKGLVLFALILGFATVNVGCSKSKGKSTASYTRSGGGRGTSYQDVGGGTQGQYSEWGVITTSGNFNSILSDFMPDVTDLETVSGLANANTGIRFRGSVSRSGSSGEIYLLVWDDYANRTGNAYYWPLRVVQTSYTNSHAYVEVADSMGSMYFDGDIVNGLWTGYVTYYNSGSSGTRNFGSFQIYANAIFR